MCGSGCCSQLICHVLRAPADACHAKLCPTSRADSQAPACHPPCCSSTLTKAWMAGTAWRRRAAATTRTTLRRRCGRWRRGFEQCWACGQLSRCYDHALAGSASSATISFCLCPAQLLWAGFPRLPNLGDLHVVELASSLTPRNLFDLTPLTLSHVLSAQSPSP